MRYLLLSLLILLFLVGCQSPHQPGEESRGRLMAFQYRYSSFRYRPFVYRVWRGEDEKGEERVFFRAEGYHHGIIDLEAEISQEVLEELVQIMEEEDIFSWHGFHESDKEVRDGFSFDFRADFEKGKIEASGYVKRPENFKSGHEKLTAYLLDLALSLGQDLP